MLSHGCRHPEFQVCPGEVEKAGAGIAVGSWGRVPNLVSVEGWGRHPEWLLQAASEWGILLLPLTSSSAPTFCLLAPHLVSLHSWGVSLRYELDHEQIQVMYHWQK